MSVDMLGIYINQKKAKKYFERARSWSWIFSDWFSRRKRDLKLAQRSSILFWAFVLFFSLRAHGFCLLFRLHVAFKFLLHSSEMKKRFECVELKITFSRSRTVTAMLSGDWIDIWIERELSVGIEKILGRGNNFLF